MDKTYDGLIHNLEKSLARHKEGARWLQRLTDANDAEKQLLIETNAIIDFIETVLRVEAMT